MDEVVSRYDDISKKVLLILSRQLNMDPKHIRPESTFIEDLGVDSLGIMKLTMALEEEFAVEIPTEAIDKIRSVGDIVAYLDKELS